MNTNLRHYIDTFADLEVLVVGEAILDSYLEGTAGRLCREAPVPIVSIAARNDVPGGAANTAVNVTSLGAKVRFLSVVGDDSEGILLKQALKQRGVPSDHVLTQPGRRTQAKHRVVADSQILVRFDQGSTDAIDPATEQALIDQLVGLFAKCDAIIVSDYGYGIFTPRVVDTLKGLQAANPRVMVADAKHLPAYREVGVTAVKPNFEEVVKLLGTAGFDDRQGRAERIAAHANMLLDVTGAEIAAVTLDTEGAVILERDNPPYRTYARPTPHSRAVGAGDTFVSALALALASGAPATSAAELASAAAGIVVSKEGTASCSNDELLEHFSAADKYMADLSRLISRVEFYRKGGRRVVFTNGCFDLLHRGHITMLNRAKALGDVLIVGVNSDDSASRLKGPDRPINSLEDRVDVLAALSCVDHLVPFDADTPVDLVRAIRPDVFVKGGNYTESELPEAPLVKELGGEVHILSYTHSHSTTGIIERIRDTAALPIFTATDGYTPIATDNVFAD
jgi:D-beta-D-heptose 7-phosphate kinase / D-beta-D-heptose 1-phosphate adenosyltransferase